MPDLGKIARHFRPDGRNVCVQRLGNGHINDTFLVSVAGNRALRFVLQRINHHVFRDPPALMENVSRVLDHIRAKDVPCLTLIPTVDGQSFHRSPDGEYWRAYDYFADAVTCDSVHSTGQATDAAATFGTFQALLADLPGPRLNETIPGFHNTPARYLQFHDAVSDDAFERVRYCGEQIDRALAWEQDAGTLVALHESGQIPERVIHNDTKLNNLLFDKASGDPLCVIDLDTVMPGIAHYDFGDMVRTVTSPTAEDAADQSGVRLRLSYYEALVEGFVGATADFLTQREIEHLSAGGKVITIETGLRFLTDYLRGDRYFGTQRPDQNLDRAKTQFALAASIDEQFDEMQDIVERVAARQGRRRPPA